MAITLLQLNYKLQQVISETGPNSPGIGHALTMAANDGERLFKKRVQEEGKNAEGNPFPAYSTRPMLAGRSSFKTDKAFNAIAGSKAKRKELKWVTLGGNRYQQYLSESAGDGSNLKKLFVLPGGYKQFRELHSRQTKFVDFTFSGDMMNNIKVKSSSSDHSNGVAVIGPTKDIEIRKMEGNQNRKGTIMSLSNDEVKLVSRTFEEEILKYWRKHGLL